MKKSYVKIKDPSNCSEEELLTFEEMVLSSSNIIKEGFRERILKAKALGFVFEESRIVAVAALKKPSDDYKNKVFSKAGIGDRANLYKYEFGWVHVLPKHRNKKYGSILTATLLALANINNEPVYAMTIHDNNNIKKVLENNKMKEIGTRYHGSTGDFFVVIYSSI
jgi:hypothetical protein